MQRIIYLFIVGALLVSCQMNNQYTIKGTVADKAYEGTRVYMQQMTDDAMVATDTAVVTNGEFIFSGVAESAELRFIALDESIATREASRVPLLVEPGKITVAFDSIATVRGTKANNAYGDLREHERALDKTLRGVVEEYSKHREAGTLTDEMEAGVRAEYDRVYDQLVELNFNYVKKNMGNELGHYHFNASHSMFEPEQQRELLALADEDFKATENARRIIRRLENLENVAVGKPFVNLTLNDPEGNEVSLSDYAGKGEYVLVDFWAAWCPPCRRDMPYLVAAYEKYRSKGFQIVGVSLDRNQEEWIQGISDLGITWPQMSDLQYWQSPVVETYAIQGIPHTVLLDKEGVIIEKNIPGSELDEKLAELLL